MTFNPNLSRFLKYLDFKIKCIKHQQDNPIRLDMDLAVKCRDELLKMQEEKVEQLKEVMPKVPVIKKKTRPKITHKKDGTLSAHGDKWFRLLREHKKPMSFDGVVEVVDDYKEPNPNSTDQVKAWLYGLGWKPCTYKFLRDKTTGDERQIEQIRKDGELTPSVLRLKDKTPEVEILEGLTIIQHRLGIFQGFIDCAIKKDGKYYLRAEIGGLTNTLRFKHKKPLVNLPGVDKPWGKEVRGCLIAEDDGEVFIGADMTSLEDTTKRHYMKPLDPDYVEEMSQPGYDPHLALALFQGEITQEQYDNYDKDKDHEVTTIRKAYKAVNYSAVYGVGAPKLARELGISKARAQELLDAYWKKNWSVRKVAAQQYTKEVGGYTWLKNPVSGFYHELRYDKDRFSTLNQSTGVYIFDSWLARAAQQGYWGSQQYHDETGSSVGDLSKTVEALKYGISKLNEDLNLNVNFGIDIKHGRDYAEVH
jgi:hypothetical protein